MDTKSNTYTIEIFEIPHSRDGIGYDLSRAEVVRTIKSSLGSFISDHRKALVLAGTYLDTNGGLVAIVNETTGIIYIHYHGLTGEVEMFNDIEKLRKHLRDKCWGMTLHGSLPRN